MWKRNVAIGLTVALTITTICFGFMNHKQNSRIAVLEQVRTETAEQVQKEIDIYLKQHGIDIVIDAADKNGKAVNDIVNDAIGGVIKDTESGNVLMMELSDAQIEMLASDLAEITYDSLSKDVLAGKQDIDVAKLETEVANAVSKVMSNYLESASKEYVTVEGDTTEIVNKVLAKLNKSSGSSGTNGMTKEEIESLVTQLVSNSVVKKTDVEKYKSQLVDETVKYLKSLNMVKQGQNGKDGANGKDAKVPVRGVDYFTKQDIENIKSDIAKNGLKVYGIRGTSIKKEASIDEKGNLVFTLQTYGENGDFVPVSEDELVVEGVAGNSLVFMDVERETSVTSNGTENNEFNLYYYTKYQNDETQSPTNPINVRYYRASDGTIHTAADKLENDKIVYRKKAGTIKLPNTDSIVEEVKKRISAELAETLVGDKDKINDLQKIIDDIKKQLENIDQNTGSLGSLTDENKDGDGHYTEGSLQWTMQQIIHKSFTQKEIEDIMDKVRNDAGKLSTTETIEVPINDLNLEGDYYTLEREYSGANKNPGFSLVANADGTGVPTSNTADIWSYCKFIEVTSDSTPDNNSADGTVKFYFAKDPNANVTANYSDKTLYVTFTGVEFDNQGTAVLTNQTRNHYGVIRVVNQDDDTVTVTGADAQIIDAANASTGTGQEKKKVVFVESIQ